MRKALIIGAGNIGRGFLAEILAENNYEITFCDVNESILSAIKNRKEYQIIYVGTKQRKTITNFKTVNSATELDQYKQAVGEADLIMTAIGVNLLPRISKQLAEAMNMKPKKKVLMACENAIRATSQWKVEMTKYLSEQSLAHTLFVDVAVDRIVPNVRHDNGDVSVEQYREMVVDRTLLDSDITLKGVTVAKTGLDPYISRKLFCVNATHAYIAWLGIGMGYKFIHEAVRDEKIHVAAKRLLSELTEVLVIGHGLDKHETTEYCQHVLERFANPALQDTVERVGRGVLRKIAPNDRFVTPLKIAIEHKLPYEEIMAAIKIAAAVEVPNDEESVKLQKDIKEMGLVKALAGHTGLSERLLKNNKK